jgi:hypothetical protein
MTQYGELTDDAADDPGPDTGAASWGALPENVRDYLIPAADAKGHSTRLYCRVMPGIGRLVQQVVASKKYPFKTMGDMIRYCIVTGAKRLSAGQGFDSVFAQVDTMMEQLAEEEQQLQFLEFFKKTQEIVDHYIVAGAPGEARRVVSMMRARIDRMPDTEEYWKTRYRTELMSRYRSLLDAPEARASWGGDVATDDTDAEVAP